MQYLRLTQLIDKITAYGVAIELREYRKARLIIRMLYAKFGYLSHRDFELFMDKADVLETSVYQRLRLEAAENGWRVSEAWLVGQSFREMQEHLSKLPVFSKH